MDDEITALRERVSRLERRMEQEQQTDEDIQSLTEVPLGELTLSELTTSMRTGSLNTFAVCGDGYCVIYDQNEEKK